ncbi:MAG: hypothetical protein NTX29_03625, partial [Actinobacteria bacterium]|nr:hypothetical protein [Actinomycetota bacterium]
RLDGRMGIPLLSYLVFFMMFLLLLEGRAAIAAIFVAILALLVRGLGLLDRGRGNAAEPIDSNRAQVGFPDERILDDR